MHWSEKHKKLSSALFRKLTLPEGTFTADRENQNPQQLMLV
jgi:hypothetical protein